MILPQTLNINWSLMPLQPLAAFRHATIKTYVGPMQQLFAECHKAQDKNGFCSRALLNSPMSFSIHLYITPFTWTSLIASWRKGSRKKKVSVLYMAFLLPSLLPPLRRNTLMTHLAFLLNEVELLGISVEDPDEQSLLTWWKEHSGQADTI